MESTFRMNYLLFTLFVAVSAQFNSGYGFGTYGQNSNNNNNNNNNFPTFGQNSGNQNGFGQNGQEPSTFYT